MKGDFEYKGYLGSAEIDVENELLFGKLLFIRDVITYSAKDIAGLKVAFREAVDDYLRTCEGLGDEPDRPCKGSFNVRVGPDLHRDVVTVAKAKNVSLNDFVCQALLVALGGGRQHVERVHKHEHSVMVRVTEDASNLVATSRTSVWNQNYATAH